MQVRIQRGPEATLGVTVAASPDDVRAAFLTLTKQFHPARFGRMSSDLQRLSNEVFLGIKSAHDTLRGAKRARPSGAPPVIQAEASSRQGGAVRSSGTMPTAAGAAHQLARGTDRASRQSTPHLGATRPSTPPSGTAMPRRTPPLGVAIARTATPSGRTPVPARTSTPVGGVPVVSRTPTGDRAGGSGPYRAAVRPITPTGSPARPTTPAYGNDGFTPPTLRHAGAPPAPLFDEQGALAQAVQLLDAQQWGGARQALHALAAKVPQSKHYRALLCYARGREAMLAGRPEDAKLEFQRSLQLDPSLAQARQAILELGRRR
jgi:hypothetical protein